MLAKPLVFLDIETTGISPFNARITEIGAIRVENGIITKEYSQLLQPDEPVPYRITQLTGISDDMLWDAPRFADIAHELEALLSDAVFVAHNVNFDFSFIKAEFGRMQQPFDVTRFCTARLSRKLYPKQGRHNLDTIVATHGITVKNRHRALDDAKALREFYDIALEQHGEKLHQTIQSILVPANQLLY